MSKRGQITLFVIIAVVVVAAVVLGIIFWPSISTMFMSQQQAEAFLASQAEPLRDAIYDCVYSVSYPAFEDMGLRAGYYDTTGLFTIDFAGPKYIIMYKDDKKFRVNKLPSLERMKKEYYLFLEKRGYAEIDSCLNNFASFKKNMGVEPQERKINATINPDSIVLNVDWPITLKKQTVRASAEQTINQKPVTLLIPLGKIWTFANDIINYETQQINFEDVEDEYNANNPQIREHLKLDTVHHPTADQVIYMITTIPYREGELPYKFNFAIDRS